MNYHSYLEHTCELPLELGPCLHELKKEIMEGKAEERSENCTTFLREVFNGCPTRGPTYTQAGCETHCGESDGKLSDRSILCKSQFYKTYVNIFSCL